MGAALPLNSPHLRWPTLRQTGGACALDRLEQTDACPLCAQVLPKNGVRPVAVEADDATVRSLASSTFGLDPDTLVDVLRHGVQFWATQLKAEALHEAARGR